MAGKHDLGKHQVVLFRRCQMFPCAWSTSNPLLIPSKSSCTLECFPSDLITTISHIIPIFHGMMPSIPIAMRTVTKHSQTILIFCRTEPRNDVLVLGAAKVTMITDP